MQLQQKHTRIPNLYEQVFINEQKVPESLEWDEQDKTSIHCLAWDGEQPVATARLQSNGKIGRMSVLKKYRNRGIGKLILQYLINYNQQHKQLPLFIHAQVQVINFYQNFGFIKQGEEFMEAGIPHIKMINEN